MPCRDGLLGILHTNTAVMCLISLKPRPYEYGAKHLGLSNTTKRTRKREFLDAMELVVPWAELVSLIEPYAPERALLHKASPLSW